MEHSLPEILVYSEVTFVLFDLQDWNMLMKLKISIFVICFVDESPAVTSFLMLLSQWDNEEIEDKLHQRVEFSKRAIGKLLQAYDRLLQRNEKMRVAIKEKVIKEEDDEDDSTIKKEDDAKKGNSFLISTKLISILFASDRLN